MRRTSSLCYSNLLLFTMVTVVLWTLFVAERGNSGTYILDRTGEKWDISQAESIGFKPKKFQYGIGRYAFKTLDDAHLKPANTSIPKNLRVIGVATEKEAHGYLVSKLSRHEIANSTLSSIPIVVGY